MAIDLQQELINLKKSLDSSLDDRLDKRLGEKLQPIDSTVGALKIEMDRKGEADRRNQRALDSLLTKGGGVRTDSGEDLKAVIERNIQDHAVEISQMKKHDRISFDLKGWSPEIHKAITTTTTAGAGAYSLNTSLPGFATLGNRFNNVRDVLRTGTMIGSNVTFLSEEAWIGSVAPVAEGVLKPEIEARLAETQVKSEYIAAWSNLSTKLLDDVAGMAGFLSERMIEYLIRAENNQLLNGDGTTPNIKGLNTAGNFTAATSLGAVNDIQQLVNGILQLRTMGRRATSIIIHPDSLGSLLLNQAAGSGEYDLPTYVTVSQTGQIYFLGVPIVDVVEQPAGTYSIVDNSGSQLLFREAPRVEFFYEDSDNVRRNAVTVRIEERVAFPVFGAVYAVKGTF